MRESPSESCFVYKTKYMAKGMNPEHSFIVWGVLHSIAKSPD